MQMKDGKLTREPKKMVARLDPKQWERAERIKEAYGFKSVYEMNQLIWACFLRAADPDGEDEPGSISVEMENVFGELIKIRLPCKDGKPVGKPPQSATDAYYCQLSMFTDSDFIEGNTVQRRCIRPVSDSVDTLHEEIADTFDSLSHAERHFEYVKRKRAMNNASLNDDKHKIIE